MVQVGDIASALPLSQVFSATNTAVRHEKRRNLITLGRSFEFWRVHLELRVFAESVGLRFEVWCGSILVGETEQAAVNWDYPSMPRDGDELSVLVVDENNAVVETERVEDFEQNYPMVSGLTLSEISSNSSRDLDWTGSRYR